MGNKYQVIKIQNPYMFSKINKRAYSGFYHYKLHKLRRKKIESEKVFPLFFPICDISTVLG